MEIRDRLKNGIGKIADRIDGQDIGLEEVKKLTKEGLKEMLRGMDEVMSAMSDCVQTDRRDKEEYRRKAEDTMQKLNEKAREAEVRLEAMKSARDRALRKESEQVTIDKLRLTARQIKYVDVDFGRVTRDRKEIIEKMIGYMKEDVNLADWKRADTLIRRTKIIILGKETVRRELVDGDSLRWIFTVPILLEFRSENDKLELEDMLRAGGWYSVFHWPAECLEFVREVRAETSRMGYSDQAHYIKVRPEEKEGKLMIKVDVKPKIEGGRFKTVAFWGIPPADRGMWGADTVKPRTIVGTRR